MSEEQSYTRISKKKLAVSKSRLLSVKETLKCLKQAPN